MKYERTGVILCTQLYDECVTFYSTVLELPVIETLDNQHSKLTVLAFSTDCYLMIETGGHLSSSPKTTIQNPVWLRFNVASVSKVADELRLKGIAVNVRNEPWGTVGDFKDPDGNMCSLKEERPGCAY